MNPGTAGVAIALAFIVGAACGAVGLVVFF